MLIQDQLDGSEITARGTFQNDYENSPLDNEHNHIVLT